MADFLQNRDNYKISIPSWKDVDKTTFFLLKIDVGTVTWTIYHRYSEFYKLHQILVANHGITVDILPPKKVIGNRDEQFIETRRLALETYVCTVLLFLKETIPKILANFLNFDQYDIHFIVKNLAIKFYQSGERLLSKGKQYSFTALEVYAINERLKQPCSSLDLVEQMEDFSHVLDFCCQLLDVTIVGGDNPVGESNICPNKLSMQFAIFKVLNVLTLKNINISCINDLGSLRHTLKIINIDNCKTTSLMDVLLCDQMYKNALTKPFEWSELTNISITNTQILQIDNSVQLLPKIRNILFQNNKMVEISHINFLKNLTHLTISRNFLSSLKTFETNNLTYLDLSENQIATLEPFSKLLNLMTINLQINKIQDVEEVRFIANIECVENIILTGNPVSRIVDYRVKVLAQFGQRAFRICLDNESTNQKELDKASILRALNKQPFSGISVQPRLGGCVSASTQQADEVT